MPADSLEGGVVSHYRITARLGGGGMGVIYSAEDTHLKRTVALKFLAPDLTRDPEARERFVQEAEAASVLDHPNICTIHDIDTSNDGQLFIAMAYYDGETLKARLARGPLATTQALDIAVQVARGLDKAHRAGIVHRDIKPANLMITRDGLVKILDFGIAKLLDRTSPTRTGVYLGTVAYMAPEQFRGDAVDQRADLWALGVVLYEMLTGRLPFSGDREMEIAHKIVNETPALAGSLRPDIPADVAKTLKQLLTKDPNGRYQTAFEVIQSLTPSLPAASTSTSTFSTVNRLLVAVAIAALLASAGTIGWFVKRARDTGRADALVSEATKHADADDYIAALTSLEAVERLVSHDNRLPALAERITIQRPIATEPEGVDVYQKPYAKPDAPWRHLGRTPMKDVRIARGMFRWKLEKDGFEAMEVAGSATRAFPPMSARGSIPPGAVLVRGPLLLNLTGYNHTLQFPASEFLIDKYEVTNEQFKAFVDAGGYAKREYWAESFVKDGQAISWEAAAASFRDRTGRPGPSTWEVGRYPAGQDDYPVTGVSWYEADAFARFSGRSLPSVYHWLGAASTPLAAYITPLSNFAGKGPAAVGRFTGLTTAGAYDMAGNAREWCANVVAGTTNRYILGGSWSDPPYAVTYADARPPFDRSEENGFRLATYLAKSPLPAVFTDAIPVSKRDYDTAQPVSDQVFSAYRALFAYDPGPLDAKVEARDESHPDWIRERVTFRAAYGDERVPAYLFLPKNKRPPYQAIVYAPGAASVVAGSSATFRDTLPYDYAVASGRAVLYPIYAGTWERNTGQTSTWPQKTRAYQEWMVRVANDARRAVDYLESRPDIRPDALAFLGTSWGAAVGTRILALEPRFKTAILLDGGFPQEARVLPELDALNYVTRVTLPTLMINGNSDLIFPLELGQKPYFARLGTPLEHKRHVVLTGGHYIIGQQRSQVVREVLDWLDRYLGPVNQ